MTRRHFNLASLQPLIVLTLCGNAIGELSTSKNDIGRTGEHDISTAGKIDIARAGVNDITDRLLNDIQYAIIDGKPEFSESVLSPQEGGYLPGEDTIQHYAHADNSWPVQYGSSGTSDTPFQFDMIMRYKRSLRKKTTDASGMQKIVMASLLPENDTKLFSIKKVRPAIELAIEKMNPLLAHHNRTLVVKFRDSKCDIAEGMNELINFYIHDEIDVLLGPCCDYAIAPCARQVRRNRSAPPPLHNFCSISTVLNFIKLIVEA